MTPPPSPTAPPSDRLLSVACPTCAATIAVDAGLLGKAAECPLCGRGFRLPTATAAAPPARRPDTAPTRSAGGQPSAAASAVSARPAEETWRRLDSRLDSGPESSGAAGAVGGDDEAADLKRTSADRAARRTRRNVFMLVAGGSILLAIVMLLGRSRR